MQKYQLIVVGGGSAGLTAAETAALLGIRVALVEASKTGGECTWWGCMPSKTLLHAAKVAHKARTGHTIGVHVSDVRIDFTQVMAHMRTTLDRIYQTETPEKLRAKGIAVYNQYARFADANTLQLEDGTQIYGKKILLATGGRQNIPDNFEVPYLTYETLFALETAPEHLIIVGGGSVGIEMSQAMARLDVPVTVIASEERLLPQVDRDVSEMMTEVLCRDGVTVILGSRAERAEISDGGVVVTLDDGQTVSGSHVLVAIGKVSNISGMNPQAAAIETRDGAPVVDSRLRTSQPHIWVAGDAVGGPQFTHFAGSSATTALINMLSPVKLDGITPMPWTIFTDPEVAHVGMSEHEARQQNIRFQVTRLPMSRADRAMTTNSDEGTIRILHTPGGKLLGATIVGYQAGEMMNEWVAPVLGRRRVLGILLRTHIYPTMGSTSAIVASEQLRQQIESGHWLGRLVRLVVRLLF